MVVIMYVESFQSDLLDYSASSEEVFESPSKKQTIRNGLIIGEPDYELVTFLLKNSL